VEGTSILHLADAFVLVPSWRVWLLWLCCNSPSQVLVYHEAIREDLRQAAMNAFLSPVGQEGEALQHLAKHTRRNDRDATDRDRDATDAAVAGEGTTGDPAAAAAAAGAAGQSRAPASAGSSSASSKPPRLVMVATDRMSRGTFGSAERCRSVGTAHKHSFSASTAAFTHCIEMCLCSCLPNSNASGSSSRFSTPHVRVLLPCPLLSPPHPPRRYRLHVLPACGAVRLPPRPQRVRAACGQDG
jgi:hypothetical protein